MSWGRFSEDGREYIIERPDTPRPWANYLTNGRYCAICSQTGGGHSFFETSGYNRITRVCGPTVLLQDRPGRYVYLRDAETGEFWSANWQPMCGDASSSRRGTGLVTRSCLTPSTASIARSPTTFLRATTARCGWSRCSNTSDKPRRIQAFPYVKWDLANYAFNATEANFSALFNEASVEDSTIFVSTRFWNIALGGVGNPNARWDKWAFMASSAEAEAFDCLDEEFVGMYRALDKPIAIEEGRLRNTQGQGREVMGAMQHSFEIAPGDEERFVVLVGVVYRQEDAYSLKRRYDTWEEAERGLAEVHSHWNYYLERTTVDGPSRRVRPFVQRLEQVSGVDYVPMEQDGLVLPGRRLDNRVQR